MRPFEVLGEIQVLGRQQTTFGDKPTREAVLFELRIRAASLGAHALVGVRFGAQGSTLMSWNELQGAAYAIRFR